MENLAHSASFHPLEKIAPSKSGIKHLGPQLVFKGGTSLSKAYRAIRRFSEDVDLTYDIRAIAPDLALQLQDFEALKIGGFHAVQVKLCRQRTCRCTGSKQRILHNL